MHRSYYQAYSLQSQIRRARRPRQQPEDVTASADIVWAAAAYADRINGGEYRKEREYLVRADGTLTDQVVREPNKIYMWQAIQGRELLTDADRETGRQARDWVAKNLMLKTLKGTVSEFEQALTRAVQMDDFMTGSDRYEIALITSQIRAWREGTRVEQATADVESGPLAAPGARVDTTVTVIKSVFSTNFNVYFITAVTADRHMVFFSYRERLANDTQYQIRGTVKAYRDNSTQLNRVKVVS